MKTLYEIIRKDNCFFCHFETWSHTIRPSLAWFSLGNPWWLQICNLPLLASRVLGLQPSRQVRKDRPIERKLQCWLPRTGGEGREESQQTGMKNVYALNEWILYYVNYNSIKPLKKNNTLKKMQTPKPFERWGAVQWIKRHLPTSLMTWNQFLEPTWWKVRKNPWKLSFDVHICTMAHTTSSTSKC